MHWILRYLIAHRTATSLAITVTLSLWMISSGSTSQARTARILTLYVFAPIQWTIDLNTLLRNVFAENAKLREREAMLNTRLALLEDAGIEHQRLRKLLGFKEESTYDLVPVSIVAREPVPRPRSMVVSAGQDERLERYMPVVDGRGVAGRIVQVLPHLSLVQLLTDPASRASVLTRTNRVVGILESDGGSLHMRYRSSDQIDTGDTVVTSGMGGVYPRGLLIGIVVSSRPDDDPLFARARVRPFVDFARLEEAFVMRLSPQWSSFRSELDSLELTQ